MACMDLDYGSSRFTSQYPCGFRTQRGPADLTSKLQVSRLSIREPETPPLPSWFGSWVASLICESSVSRSKRNSSPGVRRHRSASLRSWLGVGTGRAGEGASSCCAKHRRILAHRQRFILAKSSREHHSSAKKTSGKRNRAAPRSPANSQCSALDTCWPARAVR